MRLPARPGKHRGSARLATAIAAGLGPVEGRQPPIEHAEIAGYTAFAWAPAR
ncbi:MAG: hypothetical protein ACJ760_04075 [Thermoleophilaceae bacterium]